MLEGREQALEVVRFERDVRIQLDDDLDVAGQLGRTGVEGADDRAAARAAGIDGARPDPPSRDASSWHASRLPSSDPVSTITQASGATVCSDERRRESVEILPLVEHRRDDGVRPAQSTLRRDWCRRLCDGTRQVGREPHLEHEQGEQEVAEIGVSGCAMLRDERFTSPARESLRSAGRARGGSRRSPGQPAAANQR